MTNDNPHKITADTYGGDDSQNTTPSKGEKYGAGV